MTEKSPVFRDPGFLVRSGLGCAVGVCNLELGGSGIRILWLEIRDGRDNPLVEMALPDPLDPGLRLGVPLNCLPLEGRLCSCVGCQLINAAMKRAKCACVGDCVICSM